GATIDNAWHEATGKGGYPGPASVPAAAVTEPLQQGRYNYYYDRPGQPGSAALPYGAAGMPGMDGPAGMMPGQGLAAPGGMPGMPGMMPADQAAPGMTAGGGTRLHLAGGATNAQRPAVASEAELMPGLGRAAPGTEGAYGNGWGFSPPSAGSTESYAVLVENPFVQVVEAPLSTFSIDVDTASYANVRRFLNANRLPPPAAVRIEELVNYFRYDYPQPQGDVPFSLTTEVAGCPWNAEHRLLRIALKGREIAADRRPASNLTFLIDVSGSMNQSNKLPLVKEALLLLTEQLTENDRVSIVTYAGESGLLLPSTSGAEKRKIETAISGLTAGGSTNGGEGIQTAYAAAQGAFIPQGTNRVILATDGDFNVGVTDQHELVKLIEEQARGGVFFTALGFGAGNLKDDTLEKLADKGNGNYAYIDALGEARKALVEELSGTLITIAKDVKLQLEFNPVQVAEYRLIGYENRVLAHADFHDDRKDAGDVGAGHAVTALYELAPAGKTQQSGGVDELKYQRSSPALKDAARNNELLTLKLRYKQPDGKESRLIECVAIDEGKKYGQAGTDFKFAASVAAFGMLLRRSPHAGNTSYDAVLELAGEGLGSDPQGYRTEFAELVQKAKQLAGQ
ncbi:MAG TPA: VWA domain-containing protein, partial [Pirellulales bacterium]|nr:VWA domain-containing protein [Pirellulales bacterium]